MLRFRFFFFFWFFFGFFLGFFGFFFCWLFFLCLVFFGWGDLYVCFI